MQGKVKEAIQHFRNAVNLCETSFDGLKGDNKFLYIHI